jgi:cytochrome c-type biogenesis protein CcmE
MWVVKSKKTVFIVCAIAAAAALGFLLYSLFNTETPYVITLSQFTEKENSYVGKNIRIEGYVAPDTIDWNSHDYDLKFLLQDQNVPKKITVFYKGEKQDPSKFIDGIKVMVEGKYKGNVLIANSISYECPNEYKDK